MGGYLAYTEYKDSGVEWLGKIPSHWIISKAKFVSKVFIPQRNKPELNTDGDGLPWLTMDDMSGDRVSSTSFTVSEEAAVQAGSRILKKGAVVASCVGNFGVAAINEVDVIINQQLQAFIPTDIDLNYLRLTVSISSDYFKMRATAATIEYVNQAGFANMHLALPPLSEQHSIARFLDYKTAQIDALIAKKEALLEKLAEKRTALISQAVTKGCDRTVPMKDSGVEWLGEIPAHWTIPKVKYVARCFNGSTPKTNSSDYWDNGTIPWLSSGKVNEDRVTEPSKYISEDALKECSLQIAPKGAVVIGIVGQGKTRGTSAYLDIDTTINQNMAAIVPNQHLNGRLLHFFLQQAYQPIRNFGRGANQPALDVGLVGQIPIPLAPYREQLQIVEELEEEDFNYRNTCEAVKLAIAKLKEYRTALITNAVTGKIDVRDIKIPELDSMEVA